MTAPPTLHLAKYHGLGNDFLVALEPAVPPDAGLARRLCDRHRGIGADGLIIGRRVDGGLGFRLFNADGGEAEMSGNGVRCLLHAALDAGWVEPGVPVEVATAAGPRRAVIERRPGRAAWGTVDMGTVEVLGGGSACNVDGAALRVGVGNPHLVVAGPAPDLVDVATLGPQLERSEPAGLNVEFATLGPGPDEVTMRVWERGVGETEACGTGSCAVAVAYHHWGRVGRSVTVHQPGGAVAVDLGADGSVLLSGPSEWVADCSAGTATVEAEPPGDAAPLAR